MKNIGTPRLIIRRFQKDDCRDLHEYLSDERVVKYEPYPPQTEAQCQQAAAQRTESEDFWAVCLMDTGKLIGNVYLAKQGHQNWEIGYVFNYAYQNQGYATEAVRALLGALFRSEDAHRVFAECNPENTSSWRLLERIGFQKEGHLRKNIYFHCAPDGAPLWQDTFIYGLLREEWRPHNT